MNYKKLIIGIIVGGLLIVGASIYAGVVDRDVEVEDNAYEAGLKFDQNLRREAELGWKVIVPRSVPRGKTTIPIDVRDGNGAALRDAVVDVELSRTGGHEAHTYRCASAADGRYMAEVTVNAPGYWDAWVRVNLNKDSLRFNDTFTVQ